MKLTVKVKILPTPEQKAALFKTMGLFNNACNYISQTAFKEKIFTQVKLHRACYRAVREKFGLSAQFTVRAIGKVVESYKADKKRLHRFKKQSAIVYDQRILSFRNLESVSILTADGRCKIPIVSSRHIDLGQYKIQGQADLVFQGSKFYLCLVIDMPEQSVITPEGYIGVDMGIVSLATTSEGVSFSGDKVDKVRIRMTRFKKALQKRGTKSAKRHLKKVSGRERRFKKDINHTISKQIVQTAKDTCKGIALENLKGFRVTVRKEQKEQFGKWSFGELGKFIVYKARISGIPVFFVNPRNTSRECSECGYIAKANRKSQSEFVCKHCGFSLNADINGAINIASRASVNTPIAVHAPADAAPSPGTASLAL